MAIRIKNEADARAIAAAAIASGRGEASAQNARLAAQLAAQKQAREEAFQERQASAGLGLADRKAARESAAQQDELKHRRALQLEGVRQAGFAETAQTRAQSSLLASQEASSRAQDRLAFDASKQIDGVIGEFQEEFGDGLNESGKVEYNKVMSGINRVMSDDSLSPQERADATRMLIRRSDTALRSAANRKTASEEFQERMLRTPDGQYTDYYMGKDGEPKMLRDAEIKAESIAKQDAEKVKQEAQQASEFKKKVTDIDKQIQDAEKELRKANIELSKEVAQQRMDAAQKIPVAGTSAQQLAVTVQQNHIKELISRRRELMGQGESQDTAPEAQEAAPEPKAPPPPILPKPAPTQAQMRKEFEANPRLYLDTRVQQNIGSLTDEQRDRYFDLEADIVAKKASPADIKEYKRIVEKLTGIKFKK